MSARRPPSEDPRVSRMQRRARRVEQRKRGKPSRQELRQRKASAFGYELAMLAAGAPLADVIASAFGASPQGRALATAWREKLAKLDQRAHRRRQFEHHLRTFNGLRRHGSQWRVVDRSGYVGKRYTMAWRGGRRVRVHVKVGSTGGLAELQGVHTRTVDRYREFARSEGLIGSCQPPRWDSATGEMTKDAWFPAGDDPQYAYGQLWLTMPLSREMIAKLEANPPAEHPKRPAMTRNQARKARARHPAPFVPPEADIPF